MGEDVGTKKVAEVKSDAQALDVALRRVVSRALASASQELGQAKSILAKQWQTRKAGYVKQLSAEMKTSNLQNAEDRIHEIENAFLKACIADIQQLLAT